MEISSLESDFGWEQEWHSNHLTKSSWTSCVAEHVRLSKKPKERLRIGGEHQATWAINLWPWNLRLRSAGFLIYQLDLPLNFRTECGGIAALLEITNSLLNPHMRNAHRLKAGGRLRSAATAQLSGRSSNKPGCHAFNARCSSRKKSAFVWLQGNHFRARRPGDGQNGDRASGGVRGLSYPAGAGLPATRAALSTFECEHMPLYSKPGQVQVTSPAS